MKTLVVSILHDRRHTLSTDFSTKFFTPQLSPLPSPNESVQINELRNHSLYSPPFARTQKFKNSFTVYFTLSVITNKIHNYISIRIVYLIFLVF